MNSAGGAIELFQRGEFVLSSGATSSFKIDCDALSWGDIETVAWMISGGLSEDFGYVKGIPRGGLRLASAMVEYARPDRSDRLLIVDDVWTSGASMRQFRDQWGASDAIGAVIFARAPVDAWVLPLLSLWN